MLSSVVEAYPDTDISVHVIWAAVLGSDSEAAALEIRSMFTDPRVHQYWDPKRLCGTTYSRDVFPTYLKDLRTGLEAALPADHWWREMKRDWGNVKPENSPLWDVAFFYPAGARWTAIPPRPSAVIKQVFFYGEQGNGPSGMFFTDFAKPPADGDWFALLSDGMKELTGTEPTARAGTGSPRPNPAGSLGCQTGAVQAKLIVLYVKDMEDESTARKVAGALGAMKGVYRASADAGTKLVQVLTPGGSDVTPERAVALLRLAGYDAKEATEEQYNRVTAELSSGGAIAIDPTEEGTGQPSATGFPDTSAGRVARAFVEAFNTGNAEAVRGFNEKHRAASALASRTMAERLEQYRSLYNDWGKLEVVRLTAGGDRDISVTVRTEHGGLALDMTFELATPPSNKLELIRIVSTLAGMNLPGSNAARIGGGKADVMEPVEVISLAESLEPLQDRFNADKAKPRFIALLSPT